MTCVIRSNGRKKQKIMMTRHRIFDLARRRSDKRLPQAGGG
jgi:hypothetical protein